MFHIDATFEDNRIIAIGRSGPDDIMDVTFIDHHTGKQWSQVMSMVDVSKLVMYAASGEDSKDIPAVTYEECDRILRCAETPCPPECRPIP